MALSPERWHRDSSPENPSEQAIFNEMNPAQQERVHELTEQNLVAAREEKKKRVGAEVLSSKPTAGGIEITKRMLDLSDEEKKACFRMAVFSVDRLQNRDVGDGELWESAA